MAILGPLWLLQLLGRLSKLGDNSIFTYIAAYARKQLQGDAAGASEVLSSTLKVVCRVRAGQCTAYGMAAKSRLGQRGWVGLV